MNIPVIFITAKAQNRDLELYKSPDVIGVISKHFEPLMLAEQVLQLWALNHERKMLVAST